MILGENISFDFFTNLKIYEKTCISTLQYTLQKFKLSKKWNHNIFTNVFNMHARPLWETNTNTQFILDLYAKTIYWTPYLTRIYMFVTQEMQSMLKKCKYKQTKTLEHVKKIRNSFLNAPQMSMQQAIDISLSNILYHTTKII